MSSTAINLTINDGMLNINISLPCTKETGTAVSPDLLSALSALLVTLNTLNAEG